MFDPLTNESYENILNLIANTFKTNWIILKRKQGSYYHITIKSKESLKLLINYFNKYPLKDIKSLDYNDWLKGYYLYENRIKITPELIIELRNLKYQMNSKRVNFKL